MTLVCIPKSTTYRILLHWKTHSSYSEHCVSSCHLF